ncbi:hypothetical protein SAMN05446635_2654 [Burkholderia sp. OK233]|nr:hypothetical protein SAMN05446635_2654 [Burkholderia sp. OK233]
MSIRDYNRGTADATWAASLQARGQAQATARQWQSYCESLERQLQEARLAELKRAAELAGRDAQQKALRAALRQAVPEHPLLREGELGRVATEVMVKHFSDNGYVFDPQKRLLSKV